MSIENAKKYIGMLQSDEAEMAKLNDAIAAYIQDHPSDAENEEKIFDAVIAPMAAEAGFPVTYAEAKSVLEAGGKQELDLDELDSAAGGTGFCYIIGGSDEKHTHCSSYGGIACEYVGIGIGGHE